MENISEHITYGEAIKSQTAIRKGIENNPDQTQINNMKLVANKCFEPLRKWYGKPIGISSFFRSPKLNKAIGGASTSQHCLGMAIDIDADLFNNGITNIEIFDWLSQHVEYDQLILENPDDKGVPAWVHISYREGNNRGEKLRMEIKNGKKIYTKI